MRPHRSHRAYRVPLISLSVAAVAIAAGCSSSGGSKGHTTSGTKAPLVIGASLSLTGDFSADGQAYQKGYEFWAAQVNAKGGILGRKVQLKILNDNSSPTQVVTNYQTLISSDHVALTLGPFSSLLTAPAAAVAHRYGYAFVEGAGGATSVFAQKLNNVFDVSLPVANELDPFIAWIRSLPAGQRPTTTAYPMANDPFATPQVQRTQGQLQSLGIHTAYSRIFPEEVADYKAPADDVAASKAQAVVLGATGPVGSRVVRLLAAAPYQLLAKVSQASDGGAHGLEAQLRNGPKVYFGSQDDLAAKWAAAAAVLADSGSSGADYIDVTVASRPAAGTGSDAASSPSSTSAAGSTAGGSTSAGSAASTGSTTGG